MNPSLIKLVNDFRELKSKKHMFTADQYIKELQKIKHSILNMVNDNTPISKRDEEYLHKILCSLSICN